MQAEPPNASVTLVRAPHLGSRHAPVHCGPCQLCCTRRSPGGAGHCPALSCGLHGFRPQCCGGSLTPVAPELFPLQCLSWAPVLPPPLSTHVLRHCVGIISLQVSWQPCWVLVAQPQGLPLWSSLFHLRQCHLRLGQPEGHVHIAVQGDGGRECCVGLLRLPAWAYSVPRPRWQCV